MKGNDEQSILSGAVHMCYAEVVPILRENPNTAGHISSKGTKEQESVIQYFVACSV